jgi:hypothetical protein
MLLLMKRRFFMNITCVVKRVAFFFSLACIFLLTGCSSTGNKGDFLFSGEDVRSIWSEMFKAYDVYPVFPVGRGIQPGDVFMWCASPMESTESEEIRAQRVGSIDLRKQLAEFQSTRLSYHGALTSTQSPYAASYSNSGLFGAMTATMGLSAGFPMLFSYNASRSDVGLALPIGKSVAQLGSSRQNSGYHILEVPGAESFGLPLGLLAAATETEVAQKAFESFHAPWKCKEKESLAMGVAGEVFYTRRFSIAMGETQADALAARIGLQLQQDSTRIQAWDALKTSLASAPTPTASATNAGTGSHAQAVNAIIAMADSVMKSADSNSRLGFAGLQFGNSSALGKGMAMDYSYQAPIAFGVTLYKVERQSDESKVRYVVSSKLYQPNEGTPPTIKSTDSNSKPEKGMRTTPAVIQRNLAKNSLQLQ